MRMLVLYLENETYVIFVHKLEFYVKEDTFDIIILTERSPP